MRRMKELPKAEAAPEEGEEAAAGGEEAAPPAVEVASPEEPALPAGEEAQAGDAVDAQQE